VTAAVPDIAAFAPRLPARPRTRFAPSPTGYLHLGHVVNAIYTWGLARALGGEVLLRIEDHDRERSRPEYVRAILDDLVWLGLEPNAAANGPMLQSGRESLYERALASLDAQGLVYACACSRKQIEHASGATGEEVRYGGTCRALALPRDRGLGLRVRIDAGAELFDDALMGRQEQHPIDQTGDLLIRDRLAQWTYQFAVTVDDMEQQVDLVIRGVDLLASTGRQTRLARLLGRPASPVFLHHPLLFSRPGVKLSKSNRDTGVRELRVAGASSADVLGLAAAGCGLIDAFRPIRVSDLPTLFR
jgi:glutamyl-tRNA synthetase/glutamyl-Q tRNA(Asp) synthetase